MYLEISVLLARRNDWTAAFRLKALGAVVESTLPDRSHSPVGV